jgi:DNA-binding transcriptional LysR family regulator
VSRAIADLESTLGARLLERGRGGVRATAHGEALILRGRAVFDELRQGLQDFEALADPSGGTVRLACPESMAAGLLPSAIERFLAAHPRASVHVAQAQTVTLEFRELRERNVDLMLGRIARRFEEPDLEADVLFDERLFVVGGLQSRWARRRRIALAELAGERWILTPSNNVVGDMVSAAFQARGLPLPKPAVESFSFHLRNHLLATGDYLTVMPGSMLAFFNARGRLLKALPVDIELEAQPVAAITLKDRAQPVALRTFIECLRAAAGAMAH